MDEKKKNIMAVLIKLQPYWSMANTFLSFLKSKYIDEEILDKLMSILLSAAITTKNAIDKKDLLHSCEILEYIQEQEKQTKRAEENDIENLLSSM